MMCEQCEALTINEVHCHESGCPIAWKDYDEECKWCGRSFKPEEKGQTCCDESCTEAYHS